MSRRSIRFLCIVFSILPCIADAQSQAGIQIRVTTSSDGPQRSVPEYVNGYLRTVSGQTIPYHSSHAFATQALICRTRGDMLSIAWETDTVRGPAQDGLCRFLWLAGTERIGFGANRPPRTFQLFVNGTPWFAFQNRKDSTAFRWIVDGPDGATLEFRSEFTDTYGDLFGDMILTVPASRCPAGAPLRLEVRGENAASPDWYMTFQYAFNFVPGVRPEPVLRKEDGRTVQVVRVSLDNLSSGRKIIIESPGQQSVVSDLRIGANAFLVAINAVSGETDVPVNMIADGVDVSRTTVRVPPVARRDIYLVPYSHNDIGYSDPQPVVLKKQWTFLEKALDLIRETRDYPPDARFRWNVEMLWPLESYMKQASAERRAEIIDAVRNGFLGLNAFYGGVLTGLAQPVEMSHFFDYARQLRAEYGFAMETAVISDIPGFTWGIVPALAQSGVKYFAIAPNAFDRVGYVYEAWGDRPFYWSSQSREEKVLAWMAGAGYSSFHDGALGAVGEEKMFAVLRQIEERGGPYDIVHLPYTIQGDNGPPDAGLPDFVRSWNERYAAPRLIIATHADMFRSFEAKYGKALMTYAGDFTPYWEDGAASTAAELKLGRKAVDRLVQSEAIWSLLAPKRFPADLSWNTWRNVVLWDEHTWGASNSITEPDSPAVVAQWQYKRQFALDADRGSRELFRQAIGSASERAGRGIVDVINTHSWKRTDLVVLTPEQSAGMRSVRTWKDEPVPSQILSSGELAFLAMDIPAFGSARYVLSHRLQGNVGRANRIGTTLENDSLSLRVDPATGAIVSLVRKRDGREFVDASHGGLNDYLYVLGRDGSKGQRLSNVSVRVQESGGMLASLLVTGNAPGCRSFASVIRLTDGLDYVDVNNRLDKRMVRDKEAVHVAFPFRVPGGQIRYDVAAGIVWPETDQLAGACKNFFSGQSWVDVSNAEWGVTSALVDAPLFEIGTITAEKPWARTVEQSPTIYSYVLNNYWHTNYKADQGGPLAIEYRLRPHEGFDPVAAVRLGLDCREPLLVVPADTTRPPVQAPFSMASPGAIALSLRPADPTGALVMFLYNPTDSVQPVMFTRRGRGSLRVFASGPDGIPSRRIVGTWTMKPHGTAYVRMELE